MTEPAALKFTIWALVVVAGRITSPDARSVKVKLPVTGAEMMPPKDEGVPTARSISSWAWKMLIPPNS